MAELSDNTNWFELDASNSQPPPNGWPEGMMPSGVNDSARANMGAIKRFWDRINPVVTTTGAPGTYNYASSNAAYPVGYVDGEVFSFIAHQASQGGDNFQVNGLPAQPIYIDGFPLAPNQLTTRQRVTVVHDITLHAGAGGFAIFPSPGITTPTGTMVAYAGGTVPGGWLICNAAAISRTTYAALFGVIQTAYGAGDGSTTFNLPDGRGRTLVGFDAGNATGRLTGAAGGVSAAVIGNAGGEQVHALSTPEMPSHGHPVNDPGHYHGSHQYSNNTGGLAGGNTPPPSSGSGVVNNDLAPATDSNITSISLGVSGGNGAHNNVQPTLVIGGWIIKT